MEKQFDYVTKLDVKYPHMERIDVNEMVRDCKGVTISKGVMHRPRAPKKTAVLMVETSSIQPIGD
jgi:hypothetical protein